ncbi:MAG: Mur ligase family protein, partial [Acidobacteriota bacterium]|nr:Mur ligase family protein [Acidobacteriota bacterium]
LDDDNVKSILPEVRRRAITFGKSAQSDLAVSDVACKPYSSTFHLHFHDADLGVFHLAVPGEHNVLNATAAVAVALELGVQPDLIRAGLETFTGVDRRFQLRGQERGVTVIDDYGHHPTEIRATLSAARSCDPDRIHVLFQPHRYTRTQHLMDEFASAFHQADRVYVLDIYAASEEPIPGVTAEAMVDRIRQFGQRSVAYAPCIEKGVEAILADVKDKEMVITLGAGNVWQAGDKILEGLRRA